MLISQIIDEAGKISVVARSGSEAYVVQGANSVYALALEAIEQNKTLADCIASYQLGSAVDVEALAADGRFTLPIHHPDPAHMHLTGTGLTHLGSASTRSAMHSDNKAEKVDLTDSMKMFRMGVEEGRPAPGNIGVQPEWFYKGDGTAAVAPGKPLVSPGFADDGGEEPEMAGIYVIGKDGTPFRVGFALSNEFSDHVMERVNYLYLAHSKLRPASFGPEILVDDLPKNVEGTSRILRDGEMLWEKPFLSGEANMSHTLANLEHHHFKYDQFRKPGDLHIHMFGTATLSFGDGIRTQPGDVFEISAPGFGVPLVNPLAQLPEETRAVSVSKL